MYQIKPATNYTTVEFETIEQARQYAESITDPTNDSTKVLDDDGTEVAWFRYSPNDGGIVFEACL